jgi:hypothetical protein
MKHTFLKQGLPSKIKRATPLSALELKHLEAQYLSWAAEQIIADIRPTDGWLVNVSSGPYKKRKKGRALLKLPTAPANPPWKSSVAPDKIGKPWIGHFGDWP